MFCMENFVSLRGKRQMATFPPLQGTMVCKNVKIKEQNKLKSIKQQSVNKAFCPTFVWKCMQLCMHANNRYTHLCESRHLQRRNIYKLYSIQKSKEKYPVALYSQSVNYKIIYIQAWSSGKDWCQREFNNQQLIIKHTKLDRVAIL